MTFFFFLSLIFIALAINILYKYYHYISAKDVNCRLSNDNKLIHNIKLLTPIINSQITKSAITYMLTAQAEYKKQSINVITLTEFRAIVDQTLRDVVANLPNVIVSDMLGNYYSDMQLFLLTYNECVIQNNGYFSIKMDNSADDSFNEQAEGK